MKLFQKRWFAVVVAVLLIAAAIGISRARLGGGDYTPESASTAQKWGEEHADAYTGFVDDSARLFSAQTLEAIAAENGALDYRYGTILGLATVGSTADIEEAAYDASADLGLGEGDFLLLLDAGAEDWYLVYGSDLSHYIDNELEILFRGAMGDMFTAPDRSIRSLYADLADWCQDNLPLAESETGARGSLLSTIGGILFFVVLLVVLVIAAVAASAVRFGRRVVWGWRPRFFFGPGPFWRGPMGGPPPGPHHRPGPGPGPGSFHSGGRPGGFGGSSRGGFGGSGRGGGSHGGGFGGSHR